MLPVGQPSTPLCNTSASSMHRTFPVRNDPSSLVSSFADCGTGDPQGVVVLVPLTQTQVPWARSRQSGIGRRRPRRRLGAFGCHGLNLVGVAESEPVLPSRTGPSQQPLSPSAREHFHYLSRHTHPFGGLKAECSYRFAPLCGQLSRSSSTAVAVRFRSVRRIQRQETICS